MLPMLVGHARRTWAERRVALPIPVAALEVALTAIDEGTGHRLCGYGWSELEWSIPAGWPRFDRDGQLLNPYPEGVTKVWSLVHRQLVERFERDGTVRRPSRTRSVDVAESAA